MRNLILLGVFTATVVTIFVIMFLNTSVTLSGTGHIIIGIVSFLGGFLGRFFLSKIQERTLPIEGEGWRVIPSLLLYALYVLYNLLYILCLICVAFLFYDFVVPPADVGVQAEVRRYAFLFFAASVLGGVFLCEILQTGKAYIGE